MRKSLMQKKVVLAFLLAGIAALTIGCGRGNEEASQDAAGGTAESDVIAESDATVESDAVAESDVTVFEEKGTLDSPDAARETEAVWPEERPLCIFTEDSAFPGVEEKEKLLKTLKEAEMDAEITWFRHDDYYEAVNRAMEGTNWPDVLLLDNAHYEEYASRGALWDMTEDCHHSSWWNRLPDQGAVEKWKVDGRIYGIASAHGGYVTYVKRSWLEACELEAPKDYGDFLIMCMKFTQGDPDGNGIEGDTFGMTAPGLLKEEPPYTAYLPQLFLNAQPGFYRDEDGIWRDGFTEKPLRDAMNRLRQIYAGGYLDPDILENDLDACYRKFIADRCGVIVGPAGSFGRRLQEGLEAAGLPGELLLLPPLEDMDSYRQDQPALWCITTACENPQRAFQMLELLWNATLGETGEENRELEEVSEEPGEGTGEPEEASGRPGEGTGEPEEVSEEPGEGTGEPEEVSGETGEGTGEPEEASGETGEENGELEADLEFWRENSVETEVLPYTEEMISYYGALEALKREILTEVTTGALTPQEGLERYRTGEGGEWAERILESLNR